IMSTVSLPKHLFDKYNLSTSPKDAYELIDSLETIIKGENDPDLRWWEKVNVTTPYKMIRTFETYPFTVIDSMFFISQDGEVKPWLETEEFKETCKIYNTAYKKGVIHPDILTYPHEKVSQHTEQGKDLLADLFALEQMRKTVPEYEIVLHTFAPEKPLS